MSRDPIFPDLFAESPVAAGKTDTSREAAEAIQSSAATLRARVLAEIRRMAAYGGTATEIAGRTKMTLLNMRPRATELRDQGLIADSGKRRKNRNGKNEIVWVLPEHKPAQEAA